MAKSKGQGKGRGKVPRPTPSQKAKKLLEKAERNIKKYNRDAEKARSLKTAKGRRNARKRANRAAEKAPAMALKAAHYVYGARVHELKERMMNVQDVSRAILDIRNYRRKKIPKGKVYVERDGVKTWTLDWSAYTAVREAGAYIAGWDGNAPELSKDTDKGAKEVEGAASSFYRWIRESRPKTVSPQILFAQYFINFNGRLIGLIDPNDFKTIPPHDEN